MVPISLLSQFPRACKPCNQRELPEKPESRSLHPRWSQLPDGFNWEQALSSRLLSWASPLSAPCLDVFTKEEFRCLT